jgi:hypothetical protein
VVKTSNNKFTDSMKDQLFTNYVVSPVMILSISCGNWGDNSLSRGGYLGILRAGAGERGRKEGWGRSVRCGGSRVLSPWCVLRCKSVVVEESAIVRVAES